MKLRRYANWRTTIVPLLLLALGLAACGGDDGGGLTFAGPPECEDRTTCYQGLVDTYGLDDLQFKAIQETPQRVAELRDGSVDVALMFTTDPPLQSDDLVVLEEDQGIVASENVTPVVRDEIADAYGDPYTSLIDAISAELTTDQLVDMNTEVYVNGADSADVAGTWLEEHGPFGEDVGEVPDGPTITVGSFNFGESVTLAEIYAQAMEAAGYPVERELNLGSRELIYSDLKNGNIDFLPEYVGSALSVGFEGEATADTAETRQRLQEAFDEFDVTVLEPSQAQDKNAFVVTRSFADEHDVSSVSDLANVS